MEASLVSFTSAASVSDASSSFVGIPALPTFHPAEILKSFSPASSPAAPAPPAAPATSQPTGSKFRFAPAAVPVVTVLSDAVDAFRFSSGRDALALFRISTPDRSYLQLPGFHILEKEGWLDGIASWYGPGFHGKATASGETYDQHSLTCAHPVLPMNTLIEVENTANGNKVVVRVNDRGPYADTPEGDPRIIDLSHGAANLLKMLRSGVSPVKLRVLRWPESIDRVRGVEAYRQWVVQVGSFETQKHAEMHVAAMQKKCPWASELFMVDRAPGSQRHNVVTAPQPDSAACYELAERFKQAGVKTLVTNLRK